MNENTNLTTNLPSFTQEQRLTVLENATKQLAQAAQLTNQVLTSMQHYSPATQYKEQIMQELALRTEEMKGEILDSLNAKLEGLLRDKLAERGLSKYDADRFAKARKARMCYLLGKPSQSKYILFIRMYQSEFNKTFKEKFKVSKYEDVKPSQLKEALEFTNSFTISSDYEDWCLKTLAENYENKLFSNKPKSNQKLIEAYEDYFLKKKKR